ncbi:hypothetical protein DESC_720383 [Desulfosarcina cetonica]|nr:hypothetical protein DESC_720383 [Desulfosarcina cetonica]
MVQHQCDHFRFHKRGVTSGKEGILMPRGEQAGVYTVERTALGVMIGDDQGVDIHVGSGIVGHQDDLVEQFGIDIHEAINIPLSADADEGLISSAKAFA